MWRIHIAHRRCEQGFQGGAAPLGTRTLVQSLVCYTLIEVYRILICKKPHANTLMVRTWDLMLPRPSRILVTNPDWQLPCHFSKTVLRIPRTGELPVLLIVCGFLQGASGRAHPVFAFSPLIRDFQPHFSDTPLAHRSKLALHTPAGHCR